MKIDNRLLEVVRNEYAIGTNIVNYLVAQGISKIDAILLAYDIQSGSYTKKHDKNKPDYEKYGGEIKTVLSSYLRDGQNVLEVGVGEGTIAKYYSTNTQANYHGLDISLSRLLYAKSNLKSNWNLTCGNMFYMPYGDNSFDIVISIHAIEPNGGREREALDELLRVSSNYVVLFEPDFRNASPTAKERMTHHDYAIKLEEEIDNLLDVDVLERGELSNVINPMNPTGYWVLRKKKYKPTSMKFKNPVTHRILDQENSIFFDKYGSIFPVISGINMLRNEDAIVCFHHEML